MAGVGDATWAELRTVRVEMFGLGGRERSGSLGVVGSGLHDLEVPVGYTPTAAPGAGNMLALVGDWVLARFPSGKWIFCNSLNLVVPNADLCSTGP